MNKLFQIVFLFALAGCGAAESATQSEPGLFVSEDLAPTLESKYEEVKNCTGLSGESFTSLRIELSPYPIKCDQYDGRCMAYFSTPNTIQISFTGSFAHEVIHYLLYLQAGDSDRDHKSDLFAKCGT